VDPDHDRPDLSHLRSAPLVRAHRPSTRPPARAPERPIIVTGMYRSGSTRVFNLVRDAASRHVGDLPSEWFTSPTDLEAALTRGPAVFAGHELTDAIVDRARWDEVVVLATLRDPLDATRSLCRSLGWSPADAIQRTEESIRWIESLGSHVEIVDWRDAVGPSPLSARRAIRSAGVPVSTVEAARLSLRWRRSQVLRWADAPDGPGALGADGPCPWVTGSRPVRANGARTEERATLGRLIAGVRGRRLDERVARLRTRA
jgi:hypothetical protein